MQAPQAPQAPQAGTHLCAAAHGLLLPLPCSGAARLCLLVQAGGALLGLLQLLPVILLVLMTLFSGAQDPAYALQVRVCARDLCVCVCVH